MRILLLLSLLLTAISLGPNPVSSQEDSLVVVLDFKYFKSRQIVEKLNSQTTVPAVEMIPENKVYQRTARSQAPLGVKDPNTETVDGRSAALEKNVQESRSQKSTPVDGYMYQVKIRNGHKQSLEIVFWEYQFKERANPANLVRRQFLCSVKIKPGKEGELHAFSVLGPGDLISAESLTDKSRNIFEEKVLINRLEYTDGSILQRKGWNFAEMKSSIERATATPWRSEMCRSL